MKTNNNSDAVALNIKYLRHFKGYTQEETAEALGISRNAYANYETGQALPGLDMLYKMAEYFQVPFSYIITPISVGNTILTNLTAIDDSFATLVTQYCALSHVSKRIILDEIKMLQSIENDAYI